MREFNFLYNKGGVAANCLLSLTYVNLSEPPLVM